MKPLGILLIVVGCLLVVVGVLFVIFNGLPYFGRMPGDVHVQGKNSSFFFPIVSCIIISIVLTIIVNVVLRLVLVLA